MIARGEMNFGECLKRGGNENDFSCMHRQGRGGITKESDAV